VSIITSSNTNLTSTSVNLKSSQENIENPILTWFERVYIMANVLTVVSSGISVTVVSYIAKSSWCGVPLT
jgi:hypothetical protein